MIPICPRNLGFVDSFHKGQVTFSPAVCDGLVGWLVLFSVLYRSFMGFYGSMITISL